MAVRRLGIRNADGACLSRPDNMGSTVEPSGAAVIHAVQGKMTRSTTLCLPELLLRPLTVLRRLLLLSVNGRAKSGTWSQ